MIRRRKRIDDEERGEIVGREEGEMDRFAQRTYSEASTIKILALI